MQRYEWHSITLSQCPRDILSLVTLNSYIRSHAALAANGKSHDRSFVNRMERWDLLFVFSIPLYFARNVYGKKDLANDLITIFTYVWWQGVRLNKFGNRFPFGLKCCRLYNSLFISLRCFISHGSAHSSKYINGSISVISPYFK